MLKQRQTFETNMDAESRGVMQLLNEMATVCYTVTQMRGYSGQGIVLDDSSAGAQPNVEGTHETPEVIDSGTSETANADTWDRTDQGTDDGVTVTVQVRTVYDETGGEILYGFSRDFTYDSLGALAEISAETRYTIDAPVDC